MGAVQEIVRGRFSEDEKRRVEELAEIGLSVGQIALRMRRSTSSIYYRALASGVLRPNKSIKQRRPHRRGSCIVNPFVPAEDDIIDYLAKNGLSQYQIASEMTRLFPDRPRERGAIRSRLMLLAVIAEAAIDQSHG